MPPAKPNLLKVKIFADCADLKGIKALYANPLVKGFTTNPSLMRNAGVDDYQLFAREVLAAVPDRPISFEVFADDLEEMERQARVIATWGDNVYVKIPVTNTKRESSGPLIESLSKSGVQVNVTAIFTAEQVETITESLSPTVPAVISVFAGRIADTGVDPLPLMRESAAIIGARPKAELLWASTRELLNVYQAEEAGCHIITVTPEIIKRLSLVGKDLIAYSLETVTTFYNDARAANYLLAKPDREPASSRGGLTEESQIRTKSGAHGR
jgi:transaldolase